MAYIYIVRCAGGEYYTGITTDLARRMREHRARQGLGAKYTRAHPITALAAAWEIGSLREAARIEYRLKRLPRPKKEALVEDPTALGTEKYPLPDTPVPRSLPTADLAALFGNEGGK